MGNPFGIALDPVWAKWATEHGVSETVAAALLLLSKKRKAEEVVDRLEPDELKVVVEVVENSPECFPQGTLTALKDRRPTSPSSPALGFRSFQFLNNHLKYVSDGLIIGTKFLHVGDNWA